MVAGMRIGFLSSMAKTKFREQGTGLLLTTATRKGNNSQHGLQGVEKGKGKGVRRGFT
jgi:hypothetical protein